MSDLSKLLLRVAQLERDALVDRVVLRERAEKAEAECTANTEACKRALGAANTEVARLREALGESDMRAERTGSELAHLQGAVMQLLARFDGHDLIGVNFGGVLDLRPLRIAFQSPPAEQVKGPALTPERIEAAFAKGFV